MSVLWRRGSLACCAGYLLYDTSNMLVYFKYLGDPSAILHHLLFMLAAAYVLDQSIMAFPFIWLALGEISTPSVNLRSPLSLFRLRVDGWLCRDLHAIHEAYLPT